MDEYMPSVKHGQFTATPFHERQHDAYCPCMTDEHAEQRDERQRKAREFTPDNRRSVRMAAERIRVPKQKRGAK